MDDLLEFLYLVPAKTYVIVGLLTLSVIAGVEGIRTAFGRPGREMHALDFFRRNPSDNPLSELRIAVDTPVENAQR